MMAKSDNLRPSSLLAYVFISKADRTRDAGLKAGATAGALYMRLRSNTVRAYVRFFRPYPIFSQVLIPNSFKFREIGSADSA